MIDRIDLLEANLGHVATRMADVQGGLDRVSEDLSRISLRPSVSSGGGCGRTSVSLFP